MDDRAIACTSCDRKFLGVRASTGLVSFPPIDRALFAKTDRIFLVRGISYYRPRCPRALVSAESNFTCRAEKAYLPKTVVNRKGKVALCTNMFFDTCMYSVQVPSSIRRQSTRQVHPRSHERHKCHTCCSVREGAAPLDAFLPKVGTNYHKPQQHLVVKALPTVCTLQCTLYCKIESNENDTSGQRQADIHLCSQAINNVMTSPRKA